jgi:hypothetical protein
MKREEIGDEKERRGPKASSLTLEPHCQPHNRPEN